MNKKLAQSQHTDYHHNLVPRFIVFWQSETWKYYFANYNKRGVICNLRNNICDDDDINGDQLSFVPGLVKRKTGPGYEIALARKCNLTAIRHTGIAWPLTPGGTPTDEKQKVGPLDLYPRTPYLCFLFFAVLTWECYLYYVYLISDFVAYPYAGSTTKNVCRRGLPG